MAGLSIRVSGLPELQRALRRHAPAVQKQFRRRLRTIAQVVAVGARGRASWSRRIPAAISAGAQASGPYVRVSGKKAPHGPLYEGGEKGRSTFRHPLFGDRERWFSQRTRPFVRPEVEARRGFIEQEAIAAVEAAKAEVNL
jgi:hypothetical protein